MGRACAATTLALAALAACREARPAPEPSGPRILFVDPALPVRGVISFYFAPEGVDWASPQLQVLSWTVDGETQSLPPESFGAPLLVLDTRAWPNGPHLVAAELLFGDRRLRGEATLRVDNASADANGARFSRVGPESGVASPGAPGDRMAGAAAADLDRDGDVDLVAFQAGELRLLRQAAPWRFVA